MSRIKSESAFWKTFSRGKKLSLSFDIFLKIIKSSIAKLKKMYFNDTLLNDYDSLKQRIDITGKNHIFVTWNSVALKKCGLISLM